MVEVQTQSMTAVPSAKIERRVSVVIPPTSIDIPRQSQSLADRFRNRLAQDSFSPVNQNGSFEFDRVIKSGYVQKRTQKTKVCPVPSSGIEATKLIGIDLENHIFSPSTEYAIHL
jgi:hypothetical protein